MAETPTERRINALSGGAPLPQAATMTIAKRLLGPDLAERYGDVIGARDTTLADVARDFAVGAISRDPFKADQLKSQVFQQYRKEQDAAANRARQEEADARQKLSSWFNLLEAVKKQPKELRGPLLTNGAAAIGVELTSEYLTKLITGYEKFGKAAELLTDPEIQEAVLSDPVAGYAQLVKMGADDTEAAGVVADLLKFDNERAATAKVVADTGRASREEPANSVNYLRSARKAGEQELRMRKLGQADAENPGFQQFLGMSDDDVRGFTLRGGAAERTGSSDPLTDAIMEEITGKKAGKTGETSRGRIVVRRKGIPQVGAAPTAATAPVEQGLPQVPAATPSASAEAAGLPADIETTQPSGLGRYLGQ